MDSIRRLGRRSYLAGVAAGSAAFAGCTFGNGETEGTPTSSPGEETPTQTPEDGTEATGTGTEEPQQREDPGTHDPMIEEAATFADINAWQADGGVEIAADEDEVYYGDQSLRVEGGPATIRRNFPVPIDLSNRDFSVAIGLEQPRPTNVRIWMRDGNGDWIKFIQQINQGHPSGWLRINPSINDAVDRNLGSIESMLITVDGIEDEPTRYWVDDIRFHEKVSDTGRVMLTFDGITISQYNTIFPIMEEYGLTGTLFVPPAAIGNNNRLTQSQLEEMADAGWEIGSQSYNLAPLYGESEETQDRKIQRAKEILQDRGFGDVPAIAYPSDGVCDDTTLQLAREYHQMGFIEFGGSQKGLSQSTQFNPYFINRSRPNTHRAVRNQLEEVSAYNGLYTIKLRGVGDNYQNDEEAFEKMCDHIASYRDDGNIEVVRPQDLELP